MYCSSLKLLTYKFQPEYLMACYAIVYSSSHFPVTELVIRQDKSFEIKCNICQLTIFGTPFGASPKKFQRNPPTNHTSAWPRINVQSIPPTPAKCCPLLRGGEGMYQGEVYDQENEK